MGGGCLPNFGKSCSQTKLPRKRFSMTALFAGGFRARSAARRTTNLPQTKCVLSLFLLRTRPLLPAISTVDVHALWISQYIINLLESPLPSSVPGGLIVRDSLNGQPTGVFLDNAMALVLAVIPRWTDADRLVFLQATARRMLETGLTSVHDASLTIDDVEFFKKLDRGGKLPIRVYGMLYCEPINTYCGDEVEKYDGDRFTLR